MGCRNLAPAPAARDGAAATFQEEPRGLPAFWQEVLHGSSAPSSGCRSLPGRLGDLEDPNHKPQSSPNTPGTPCAPKPCASPKLHVPPGSWHGACAIHSILPALAALCVFGVYIPGSLDTADHTRGASRHRLTSSSQSRSRGQEVAWLLQLLVCQTVHVNPVMARTQHRGWEGKYSTECLQKEGWG